MNWIANLLMHIIMIEDLRWEAFNASSILITFVCARLQMPSLSNIFFFAERRKTQINYHRLYKLVFSNQTFPFS